MLFLNPLVEVHQAVVSEYYQALLIIFTTVYNETISDPLHFSITLSDSMVLISL